MEIVAADRSATTPLLAVSGVRQSFRNPSAGEIVVLDNVDLSLREGEIVGLLGRSGSGKSTLLRIIAGLITPTAGRVIFGGQVVAGPCKGLAMVFQSFALFPWLTVLQNVEAGLEARGVSESDGRRRALAAIDLIGLDGFEPAYPRELSGGMRQRVGFARALVVDPLTLLLDEPFSALDVLTAETLRTDFLELWHEKKLPIKSVLMVTHNIEEAVLMCDRILIFSANPGRVAGEIRIALPYPRNRFDPAFRAMVDDIYGVMTARPTRPPHGAKPSTPPIAARLPVAGPNLMSGMIELLASSPFNGHADLPVLGSGLQMEVDELFPVAEALQMLGFAVMEAGDIRLTPLGQTFAGAELDERKRIFAERLRASVPLASHIRQVLDERPSHRAPLARFETELEDFLSDSAAQETLHTVTQWARFGELFSYDDRAEMFSLENPTQ